MSLHPQFTLADRVTLEGVGLHSGAACRVTLAPSTTGEVLFHQDGKRAPATAGAVGGTARCTALKAGGVEVSTVEHLLATLFAFGVTSVDIHVDGPEVPILDGSAAGIAQALRCGGLRRLPGERPTLRLNAPVWVEDGTSSLLAIPHEAFRVTAAVDYPHPRIGRQVVDVTVTAETFERDLAPARTFGFEHELAELARRGLARGGSLDNALVFMNDGSGTPERLPDEPARHKALDVIGDLSLVGALPLVHIVAVRPSHRLNAEMARRLNEFGIRDSDAASGDRVSRRPSPAPAEGDRT